MNVSSAFGDRRSAIGHTRTRLTKNVQACSFPGLQGRCQPFPENGEKQHGRSRMQIAEGTPNAESREPTLVAVLARLVSFDRLRGGGRLEAVARLGQSVWHTAVSAGGEGSLRDRGRVLQGRLRCAQADRC